MRTHWLNRLFLLLSQSGGRAQLSLQTALHALHSCPIYAFKTGLLRDVIYGMMFYSQRRALHVHLIRLIAFKLAKKMRAHRDAQSAAAAVASTTAQRKQSGDAITITSAFGGVTINSHPQSSTGSGGGGGAVTGGGSAVPLSPDSPGGAASAEAAADIEPDLVREIEQELKSEGFYEALLALDDADEMANAAAAAGLPDTDSVAEDEESENLHGILYALRRHKRLAKIGEREGDDEDGVHEHADRSRHNSRSKQWSRNRKPSALHPVNESVLSAGAGSGGGRGGGGLMSGDGGGSSAGGGGGGGGSQQRTPARPKLVSQLTARLRGKSEPVLEESKGGLSTHREEEPPTHSCWKCCLCICSANTVEPIGMCARVCVCETCYFCACCRGVVWCGVVLSLCMCPLTRQFFLYFV